MISDTDTPYEPAVTIVDVKAQLELSEDLRWLLSKDFVAIQDAECDLVCLVRKDKAEAMMNFLNGVTCEGTSES